MISPIQKAVFDERLPQINDLLDTQRMRALFERELIGASGYCVEDCQIVRAKLRPGRNCLVSYRLKLVEAASGERRDQFLSLVAFGEGESRERFAMARRQPIVPTVISDGVLHLPELEAVVWAFPNDRKLTALAAIADPERLKGGLPEVVARGFGEEWEIATSNSEVVSYAAERSCTVRAALELFNRRTGETALCVLFGKTYCPGEGGTTWQAMRQLRQSEACGQGRLLMPKPLAYQPETHTLWQQGLMGKTLAEHDDDELPGLLKKAGVAVAALHRTALKELPRRSLADLLSELEAVEKFLARCFPSCRQKLGSLVSRLSATAGLIGQRPAATLHGDLHLGNFFATGGEVALIDWDNLCQGDPLQDIGSFIASLHHRWLSEAASVPPDRLTSAFVEAYRANADWESSAALDWFTAAALIHERAYRHVTRLKADRPGIVEDLIELACRFTGKL